VLENLSNQIEKIELYLNNVNYVCIFLSAIIYINVNSVTNVMIVKRLLILLLIFKKLFKIGIKIIVFFKNLIPKF